MPQEPTLYTASEVAARVKVSPETIRRWVREGLLAAIVLPSGQLRFTHDAVEAMVTKVAS